MQAEREPHRAELRIDLTFCKVHAEEPANRLVEFNSGPHRLDL